MQRHNYEEERGSLEYFFPSPHSNQRQGTAKSAIFNLVSTVVGGGILSLPYAVAKCGIVVGVILLVTAAMASDFSLYILVSCTRRSGAHSYEDVAAKAFGSRARLITMLLLIILTFLAFVGYIVLTRDLAAALVERYLMHRHLDGGERNWVAISCVAFMFPVMLFRSITSLRFTSFLSVMSIMVLGGGISFRAVEVMRSGSFHLNELKWLPTSFADVIYAFPIISVAYICHFNILPMYGDLKKPTRLRLKKIVHATMASTCSLYTAVGLMGYIYAFGQPNGVQDDILNNFDVNDHLINIGRAGLLSTLLLGMPLLVLPCRATLFRFISVVCEKHSVPLGEEVMALVRTPETEQILNPSTISHVLMTFMVLGFAILLAFSVPGISFVWSLMGSSVGLLISYVVPTLSYIKIRRQKSYRDHRKMGASVLFVVSALACLVCTFQAIVKIF